MNTQSISNSLQRVFSKDFKKQESENNKTNSFRDELSSMIEVSASDKKIREKAKENSPNERSSRDKNVENNDQLENNLTAVASTSFIIKETEQKSPVIYADENGQLLVNGNSYKFDIKNESNSLEALNAILTKELKSDSELNIPSELKSKKLPENALIFKQGDQYTLINPDELKNFLKNNKSNNSEFIGNIEAGKIKSIDLNGDNQEIQNLAKSKKLNDQIELIEKFGNSKIKVSVEENPKTQIIRETTNNLLSEHKKFLENIKKRAGLIKVNHSESITQEEKNLNTQQEIHIQNIKESDKTYFKNLEKELDSSKREAFLNGGEKQTNNNNSLRPNFDMNNLMSKINEKIGSSSNFSSGDFTQSNLEKSDKLFSLEKEAQNFQRVRASELINETARSVKLTAPNGSKTARMILNPESLGKVFVKIEVINNVAKLNIKAESAEATKLIEGQLGSLIEKLNFSGIQTDDVKIEQQKFESDSLSKDGSRERNKQEENKTRKEFLDHFRKYSFSHKGSGNE